MTFKPHEIDFMRGTVLGRLATIQSNGTLQNSPVGFTYNDDLGTIDIFGYHMSKSQKYRNIASNPTVAFVVDDITRRPTRGGCAASRSAAPPSKRTPLGRRARRATNSSTRRSSGSHRDGSSASASTTPTPTRTCSRSGRADV
jgi:pyridoxamine 5'-phosphate oxidase family protein